MAWGKLTAAPIDALRGGAQPPDEVWVFAQTLLGRPIPSPRAARAEARAKREQLAWLASISTRHEQQLRGELSRRAAAIEARQRLEWLATFSTRHERELSELRAREAEVRRARARYEQLFEDLCVQEDQWDPAKHPRLGGPPNAGWFASTGGTSGGTGASAAARIGSTSAASLPQDEETGELTVTPSTIKSTGWVASIRDKLQAAGEIGSAFVAGLGTGAKAVVNGLATAARSVATLGLNTEQLELIGVTKEDRERGYDTAVTISTGSGQVLIAVGTGGLASALAKGGTIARTAGGVLVAYDSAGNAVGVVQGVYDAAQNGVTLTNGTQVAASALGLSANVKAAKGLFKSGQTAPSPTAPPEATQSTAPKTPPPVPPKPPETEFRIGKHGDMPSPRPGQHSHHGMMSAWMERAFPGYDPKKAPAILMPDVNHRTTFGIYRKWRAEITRRTGNFDWTKITEADMRTLSERMFDAAGVPASAREDYWAEFERMKAALQTQPRKTLEASFWSEQMMKNEVDVLTAEQMQQRYGSFYKSSPMTRLDSSKVPHQFRTLIPYAEFWGIADDWTREDLVRSAPPDVRENLKRVVTAFDNALDEWLAGSAADDPNPTDEYIAFCAMGMAADYA